MLNWIVDTIDSLAPKSFKRLLKRISPGIEERIYGSVRGWTKDQEQVVTIRRGPLAGRRFSCNLRRERDYYVGLWEVELVNFLEQSVKPGDIYYDIGVHNGYIAMIVAQRVGKQGKVIGFEPNPNNRAIIEQNLGLNADLAERIKIESFAISNERAKMWFAKTGASATGALDHDKSPTNQEGVEVDTLSLDEFVAAGNPAPNALKMDIEGGERWALPGMRKTLMQSRPIVAIEIHDAESWQMLQDICAECRYQVETLDGKVVSDATLAKRDQFVMRPL